MVFPIFLRSNAVDAPYICKRALSKKNFRKLLQRDGIDARSVQKTPVGTVKNVRPVHFLPTCLLRKHAAA